ncbi:hypothetical protein [Tenacibaculum xiamenense]|uniref:hypothetical protein n=1 Tax=Tenacibaculum xiamenense TaxID=1261553 RepID=UPI003893E348
MKKTFKKAIIPIILVTLSPFLVDLYVFRGYFSTDIVYILSYPHEKELIEVENNNLSIEIDKSNDDFILTFKNNSIKPYLTLTYRWNIIFDIDNEKFLQHYRTKYNSKFIKEKYNYSVSCGTGLSTFSINPYESFQSKISYRDFLKDFGINYCHYKTTKNDTIMDVIHNKPLLFLDDKNDQFKVFNRADLTLKDSIEVQLYLPVFSYDYKEVTYVKSNYIKLPYLNIIDNLITEKSESYKRID